jgi:IS5 family transposase
MTLRQFTEFHRQRVPKHHAFHRDFNRLTPETLEAINDLIVQAAVDLGLEDGSKLLERWPSCARQGSCGPAVRNPAH